MAITTPRTILLALALFLLVPLPSHAQETFVVEEIAVEGADRVAVGTVLNYLPVRTGESFSPSDARRAIRSLYDTELFDDIELARDGTTLIVRVEERPAIGELNIDGSFEIGEEELRSMLAEIGLERGRIFNRALLEQVEQELRRMLLSQGKYAMDFDTEVRDLDRNRVAIDMTLNSGKTARIREINLVGNERFDDDTLKDLMESGIPGTLEFLSSADEYSRNKLEGDLEELRSWYLDRGYLQFSITSSQVTITPDKKDIYITINVEEGEQFRIRDVTLDGEIPIERETLVNQIQLARGDLFSRKDIAQTRENMTDWLAAAGYAFANINVDTEVDEEAQEVSIRFFVEPGNRVYVRRVIFTGHYNTRDYVYRREMRQLEGGRYSPQKVERSRIRIQRLPQVEQISVDTDRVSDDQVDVVYSIRERDTGSLSFGAGFNTDSGVVFNVGFEQRNILGTGRDLEINLDNSDIQQQVEVLWRNPFYTEHGVSRTFNLTYRETDPDRISSRANFFTDEGSFGVDYGIPLSEFDRLTLGIGPENIDVQTTASTPQEIVDFLDEEGSSFFSLEGRVGFRRDSRNRTRFPTRGRLDRVSFDITVPGSDVEYYRVRYDHSSFYPLTDSLTLAVGGNVALGDGFGDQEELPFFKRFFAGGIRSVRGFERSSLGENFADEDDDARGGDFRTTGSLEVLFPPPFFADSAGTRLSLFYDFGNVFRDYEDFEASRLRSSVGVSYQWESPVGPMTFVFAETLNEEPTDDTESFQFSFGTRF